MKQYFNVTFQYSESVYCANIAHAETVADVEAHYSKYAWVSVSPAADYEVEEARRRGKPIVEVDPQPVEEAKEERKEKAMTILEKMAAELEARKDRGAWSKGVTVYALELVEQLAEAAEGGYIDAEDLTAPRMLRKALLNGADDWSAYSWGGCSLIYNSDIAARLCCPSELKRTRNGERRPNSREEWLDTQARALHQAASRVLRLCRSIVAE